MNLTSFIPGVGEVCLALSLATSVFTLVSSILGERRKDQRFVLSAERALYATTAFITFAIFILWYCLLTDNFLVRYVYGYSNHAMPTIYKFTALWGGQDGSLLFWMWLTSIFASISIATHRQSDRVLIPYAMAVFATILGFFSLMLVYQDNPFRLFPEMAADGRGLNPLLQNPSMAIHPPSLYLGYVGMSVPFAFAVSALITNRLDARWITATRIWTLIAWFFLSIGNILGAEWAYTVLGWGGFWGWDPVENAAIMPWFTASAFLHSVMIQEKRGMLKFWNMNLIVISFCLTVLGTYLTRSGVVQSVHSFARSSIGYWFLSFLIFVILFCAYWIYRRREELKSPTVFESFLSKESAFVVNNMALVGTAFIILWCTLFPTASELIIGTRIIVGPPFFNKMLAPVAIILLILTGIGPVIGWRKASKENLQTSFVWPIVIGFVAMGAAALLHMKDWYVLLTVFGCAFVVSTIVMEFYRGATSRMIQYQESWSRALWTAVFKNNRKYGGYIVHFGLVLIFAGIAGTTYKRIYEFDMKPGDVSRFESYSVYFKNFESFDHPNQEETYAVLEVSERNRKVADIKPARFFYKQQEQPATVVDIYSKWNEDVYFTLGSIDPQTEKARIQITLNPFVSFLWLGGLILAVGGLIAMLPPLRAPKTKATA